MTDTDKRYTDIRKAISDGWTYSRIIQQYKCSPKTIYKLRTIEGMPPSRGRPPVVTEEIKEFIETNSLEDARTSDSAMCTKIKDHFGVTISRATVANARNNLGFKFRPPMTRQMLTPDQIDARQEFSEGIITGQEIAPNLVFSDESRFEKFPGNTWRRIKRGAWNETCFVEKTKFSAGVMVWAAIGVGYKSPLMVCHGNVDSNEYCRILEASRIVEVMNEKHGVGRWTFMQDGAPSHNSAQTTKWLHDRKVAVLPGWPANSPDLNPIENLWAILKRQVKKHDWQANEQITDVLQRIWENLDQEMIDKLVLSFTDRCCLVRDRHGESVSQDISSHRRPREQEIEDPMNLRNDDDELVIQLHREFGPKWSIIGQRLGCNPATAKYRFRRATQRRFNAEYRAWEPLPPIDTLLELANKWEVLDQ